MVIQGGLVQIGANVRTIAVINQKGGCGKTTSAINLAAVLAARGLRTLLADLDPQSHCAAGLAVPEARIDLDIGDAMLAVAEGGFEAKRLIWPVSRNLDLAPSRIGLAGLEAHRGGLADRPDREHRLARVLGQLSHSYDVVLVDCSPSIGLLTFNALTAADAVIVPVETSFFSLHGATRQLATVRTLTKRLGRPIRAWLLPTIHDVASPLAADLLDELRRRFGGQVLPSLIRRDVSVKEAASFGQPVIEYEPESLAAHDYLELGTWLIAEGHVGPQAPLGVSSQPSAWSGAVIGMDAMPSDGRDAEPTDAPVPVVLSPSPLSNGGGAELDDAGIEAELDAAIGQRSRDVLERTKSLGEQIDRLASFTDARVSQPTSAVGRAAEASPAVDRMRQLFGARETKSGVLFVQPISLGEQVSIAGDFNDWSEALMRRNEALGVFELCVPMAEGRHQYRLIVDGHWTADPYNSDWEMNERGEPNCVIEVHGNSRATSPANMS